MKTPPPFEPTLHPLHEEPDLPPMYALNMGDGYAHLLGERWQVVKITALLNQFLVTGETSEKMDGLAEELGFKWLNVEEAIDFVRSYTGEIIPGRTIRYAVKNGFIRGAKKHGRDWRFPRSRFIGWLKNRPKPGRKDREADMLAIKNKQQAIISTNFWETEYNAKGLFFCSINAGCFRILVPDKMAAHIPDMRTAKFATIERTSSRVIITFDDESDTPYRLDLSLEQFDRLPAKADSGRTDLVCAVWVKGPLQVFSCRASYTS